MPDVKWYSGGLTINLTLVKGGTANRLLRNDGSKVLDSLLSDDGTNVTLTGGNLGIGVTPAAKLHVGTGPITGTPSAADFLITTSASAGVGVEGLKITRGSTTQNQLDQYIGFNMNGGIATFVSRGGSSSYGAFTFLRTDGTTYTSSLDIDVSGNVSTASRITSSSATGGIGYAAGAGSTVTQLTSKATGVTLNNVTGEITMNAAALAANTSVSFVLTNSAISGRDYVHVQHIEGGTVGGYVASAGVSAGTTTITVRNITAGSLSEAIVLKFVVFKSAIN